MRLVAALALLAGAAQDEYLPLKEGTRWTYAVEERLSEAGSETRQVVAEVAGARAIGDAEWTEVRNFLGYASCYLRVSPSAIEIRLEAADSAPSLTILKLPARDGETWTGRLGAEDLRFATGAEERVELGDAMVRALHVSFKISAPEKHAGHAPTQGDLWFAAGLGIVKAQVTKDLDCHSSSATVYRLKR